MRRWSVGILAVTGMALAGCQQVKDMFSARPVVAAEVGGQQLTVDRLAAVMVSIKGLPLTPKMAEALANMWVDYALFAQALAAGRDLTDSAIVVEVLWPDLAEARGGMWHDTLVAHRSPLGPQVADSIYSADSIRVLQHILIRVSAKADSKTRATARRKIDQINARVRAGADFRKLAGQLSEDPGSKDSGGYLPAAPRGKYLAGFDTVAWKLAPGAMSGVVETPFGFHVIRRPPVDEVREQLLAQAGGAWGQVLDSLYLDSLGVHKHLRIARGAPALMRQALADMDNARHSTRALGSYDGGDLTLSDFIRWVTALGPSWAADLDDRPDSSLTQFARLIAQNKLLLGQADSAGITVSAADWAGMQTHFRSELDSLRQFLGLTTREIADPSVAPAERIRVAALKLGGFWDQVASGKVRPPPMPGPLSAILRAEGGFTVNVAALDRTVEIAGDLKAQADSALDARQPPRPPGSAPRPAPAAPAPGVR